jgi:ABC-2 type transport system permease protein
MRLLLSAELLKLVKQSKTYYALGSILVIELLILVTAYFPGEHHTRFTVRQPETVLLF